MQTLIDRRNFVKIGCFGLIPGVPIATSDALSAQGHICTGLLPANIITLDPHRAVSVADGAITPLIWEGLVRVTEQGVLPLLASTWESSKDRLVWKFSIRPGVKFQNGEPLTVTDILVSFKRILDDKTTSMHSTYSSKVLAVTALDTQTIQFTLSSGGYSFVQELGLCVRSAIVPASTVNENGELTALVGTGIYSLKSQAGGERVELTLNPNYWLPSEQTGMCTDLVLSKQVEADKRVMSLSSGGADFAFNVPRVAIAEALNSSLGTSSIDTGDILRLTFNNKRLPFRDIRWRYFVASKIDRAQINSAAFDGQAKVLDHPFADSASPLFLDQSKFASNIEQPPLTDEELKSTVLELVNLEGYMLSVVDDLVRQLEKAGAKVKVVNLPADKAFERLKAMEYDLAVLEQSHIYYWTRVLEYFNSRSENNFLVGGYSSQEFDDAYKKAANERSEEDARDNYSIALNVLLRDNAAFYFGKIPLQYAWNPQRSGAKETADGVMKKRDPF